MCAKEETHIKQLSVDTFSLCWNTNTSLLHFQTFRFSDYLNI